MFALLICLLTLDQVQSACIVVNICAENPAVQTAIVDQHNAFRRAVEPPASDMLIMRYDADVAASAQAWVDRCILAHGDPTTRMLNGYELGENLFYSSKRTPWTDAIAAWHSEVASFTYPVGSANGRPTGHYTQVIWNSSYKVGCGVTFCPDEKVYFYACHYYRAGNFKGWPPYTAGPPCASCPDDCDDKLCTNPCPIINHFINCPTLKHVYGCRNKDVYNWCPASCKCTNEIIPVA
ncbi:cysteine-rich venom protein isoform X3 [Antennarius striatus]|uniref:cysteine-rich venom protein isoform X3 n=1 Tax=Antennarius striatus TaxID=241820 RepID=UPI0035B08DD9